MSLEKEKDSAAKEKLIEKIKKLLALSTSDNIEEASRAMEAAQKLMERYTISSFDLENKERKEEITKRFCSLAGFTNGNDQMLENLQQVFSTIGAIYGCVYLIDCSGRIRFGLVGIGFPTNLEIAEYSISLILEHGRTEYKREYKKNPSFNFAPRFWQGFSIGIQAKFGKIADVGKGMIVYDPVKNFIKDNFEINHIMIDGFSRNEIESGIKAGKSAELRSGLREDSSKVERIG